MKVCFVGLENLPVLAREYDHHYFGGEQVQQTLLAKALVTRGYRVSMVVRDYGQSDTATWHGVTTYKAYRPERRAGLYGHAPSVMKIEFDCHRLKKDAVHTSPARREGVVVAPAQVARISVDQAGQQKAIAGPAGAEIVCAGDTHIEHIAVAPKDLIDKDREPHSDPPL